MEEKGVKDEHQVRNVSKTVQGFVGKGWQYNAVTNYSNSQQIES
jgi:hypothetical protein